MEFNHFDLLRIKAALIRMADESMEPEPLDKALELLISPSAIRIVLDALRGYGYDLNKMEDRVPGLTETLAKLG